MSYLNLINSHGYANFILDTSYKVTLIKACLNWKFEYLFYLFLLFLFFFSLISFFFGGGSLSSTLINAVVMSDTCCRNHVWIVTKGTDEHSGWKTKRYLQIVFNIMAFQYLSFPYTVMQLYRAFSNVFFHWYNIWVADFWIWCVFHGKKNNNFGVLWFYCWSAEE